MKFATFPLPEKELNEILALSAAPEMPVPRLEDCITQEELMDDGAAEAEAWAEGAWLRHAESLGWEEQMMEERYALMGY